MKNINLKNIIVFIIGIVVLFIPTYVSIAYFNSKKPDINIPTVTTITINDPRGNSNSITSDNDQNGVISMFNAINKSGSPVSALPDNLSGTEFLLVVYSDGTSEISFKYYFNIDSSECYYTDNEGKVFKIAIPQAKEFLGSPYSVYLYKTATPPVLTSGENVISATNMNWFYLVSGGTFQQFDYIPDANSSITYPVGNNFSFDFSIAPSSSNLKIYQDDVIIFDGAPNQISNLNLTRNDTLEFLITAGWDQTSDCEYYGTAEYRFDALVLAPAEFKLGEATIEHGDVVVLSGINVTDPKDITVTFEPELSNQFTPTFFTDGDLVHALIPFSYDVPNGNYKINVSYGITNQVLELTVGKPRWRFDDPATKFDTENKKDLVATFYSEEDVAQYNELYKRICKESEPLKYFSGAFINYQNGGTITSNGVTIKLGFSREKILDDGRTFKHDGIDFGVKASTDVPAMSSGKIVFADYCDVLGKFVVIDHGYGLKTWYAHLDTISVSVGDIVTTSQIIGKTGSTGFTVDDRLHIEFTVFDIPVAPFSIWDEGLIIPTFD